MLCVQIGAGLGRGGVGGRGNSAAAKTWKVAPRFAEMQLATPDTGATRGGVLHPPQPIRPREKRQRPDEFDIALSTTKGSSEGIKGERGTNQVQGTRRHVIAYVRAIRLGMGLLKVGDFGPRNNHRNNQARIGRRSPVW